VGLLRRNPNFKRLLAADKGLVARQGPTRQLTTRFYADHRNFYKVEKWTKDGTKVDRLLYAGSNLERARDVFANATSSRVVPLSVMYISAGRR
jgi:hypothetical protein